MFTDPYLWCCQCGDRVVDRSNGNIPCGHMAEFVSVCPTWNPDTNECHCIDPDNKHKDMFDTHCRGM